MAGPPPPNMGSINRESFHADGPPPSYSETDIYSATTRSPQVPPPTFSAASPGSGSGHGPAAPGDNIAFPMSPTSTTGSVIYTPPDTPQTVTSNIEKPQQLLRDRIACATRYFETRSYLPSTPRALEYSLTVTPDSVPADIPYPENWAAHDVTAQDWATFVNFLLPDHDSVKNESIFGEEAKSEDGSDAKSATYNANTRPERQAADPSKRHLFRKEAEATVYHWNTGFFTPRGVVVLFVPGEPVHMPGGQEAARNNPLEEIPQVGASYQREAMPQRRDGRFQGGWGGPRMNDGGIRQGDRFVVDGNGIRIGDLHIDSRGIRMGEQGAGDAWLFGPGRGRGHMHAPRGRGPHNHHHGARNHSSSTSSSSSSDSSSSCESIGSLPDHDDIKDEQLPFYIARVEQWIANPHEVRSKADVKQLKAELKAGKRNTAPLDPNIDRKELKKQSKAVAHQWKSLKRDQKRGKKERKRAEKEAKRRIKRELRESRRDCRREQKGRGRGRGRANPPGVPGFPSVPSKYIPGWVQSHTDHVPIPPQGRGDPWGWPGRGFHG